MIRGKIVLIFLLQILLGQTSLIGLFALTTGHGLEKLVKEFEEQNDDYSVIMAKVIADRLVEAFAERMHERVELIFGDMPKPKQ
ncbi:MAG: hypothetical protein Ct9H90mP7_0670 [Candidatus Neomarinimicrobiota bacterium]|nr:MAG: hypothetical protein Ct9H90mP7_0670 [Candidatus Neomarinimicrobiota bacterium]